MQYCGVTYYQSSRIKTQVSLQNRRYFLVFFRRRKHRQALGGHGTRDRFTCTTKVHIICLYHRRNCKTHMELLAGNCAALSTHMTFREGGSVLITDHRSSRAIERAQPQILHFWRALSSGALARHGLANLSSPEQYVFLILCRWQKGPQLLGTRLGQYLNCTTVQPYKPGSGNYG